MINEPPEGIRSKPGLGSFKGAILWSKGGRNCRDASAAAGNSGLVNSLGTAAFVAGPGFAANRMDAVQFRSRDPIGLDVCRTIWQRQTFDGRSQPIRNLPGARPGFRKMVRIETQGRSLIATGYIFVWYPGRKTERLVRRVMQEGAQAIDPMVGHG